MGSQLDPAFSSLVHRTAPYIVIHYSIQGTKHTQLSRSGSPGCVDAVVGQAKLKQHEEDAKVAAQRSDVERQVARRVGDAAVRSVGDQEPARGWRKGGERARWQGGRW